MKYILSIILALATFLSAQETELPGWGLYVGAGLGPGARDGIMVGIAKLGPSIRATRIGIDFTAFVVGVLLGGSYGLGTIFMVVTVGPIVQYSLKRFDKGAIFSL